MKFLLLSLAVLACMALVSSEELDLEGGKVFHVYPVTKKQHIILAGLDKLKGVDFWQRAHVLGREARIFVAKYSLLSFTQILKGAAIKYEVIMEDPKKTLTEEVFRNDVARRMRNVDSKISFTAYNRHDEINEYLDDLATKYNKTVTVVTAGPSGQGRALKYIKISSDNFVNAKKPVIVVDAGIHAREWIAPSVALYIINKLVEDVTESNLATELNWIIFPVLNPDGYEHSHTTYRMWRKTRSTESSTTCPGVDGNRNFDYMWMQSGSSNNPCSDIFAGKVAFSEPETRYLRDVLKQYKGKTGLYLALHSYGSYFLYPYGYDGSNPSNLNELDSLGLKVAKAIDDAAASGSTKYLVGNSATALNYAAAGASDDYAMGAEGVQLSYTLELPGGGSAGFDLPASRISQVVKETWEGIKVLGNYVITKGI